MFKSSLRGKRKISAKIHLLSQRHIYILLILLLTNLTNTYPQSSSNYVSKRGGICFRTDDNQLISRYLEYASIFDKYNQKFSFAINLGTDTLTPEYVEGLKQLQADGHEMMDHTPSHRTNYFRTILPTEIYINHPGVHRISGNKIELQNQIPDIKKAKRTGYCNIEGNIITSTNGIFSNFSNSDCYLYFPSLNELTVIDNFIDSDTVEVSDFWYNEIDLGSHQNVQFYNFDVYNIHITIDGIKTLGEESLRLAQYYNLKPPSSWIEPGISFPYVFPYVHKEELKQALGDEYNYKAAGIYPAPSLKVFDEYNPDNDDQFAMDWSDFKDASWTLEQCKQYIADRVARHYVSIGATHFTYSSGGLLGGWSGFLDRTEKLIQWCVANNIPIRTYSEWADILYNQTPDPNENIFPPVNVDLDDNNIPDGYTEANGILEKTDGVPTANDYCYSVTSIGDICSIQQLGGIEKGTNEFEIWTKGAAGDFIEVDFKVGSQDFVYKFPAGNNQWTKYNLLQSINGNTTLNIPNNISVIDITIRCSNYSSGEVKVSGMKLAKSLATSNYLSVNPTNLQLGYATGSSTFNIKSNTSWSITKNAGWINVSPASDSGDGIVTVMYDENQNTSQRSGTITVTGGGITKTVTLTQDAHPFVLEVNRDNLLVGYGSGNTTFNITSNTSWSTTKNAGWINVSPASDSGDGIVTVIYDENQNTSQRSGTITVTGGGITRAVTLTQDAHPFVLEVNQDNLLVGYGSGNTTFNITSNTSWSTTKNAGWINVSPASDSGDGTVTVRYDENQNTSQRSGTITVTGGGITRAVTLTQDAHPFVLTTTSSELNVANVGGSTTFTVNSNTSWAINNKALWLTISPISGFGTVVVTANYSDNQSSIERSTEITITGGGITNTIKVIQAAQPFALTVNQTNLSLGYNSGSTELTLTSNTNWTANTDVSWLTISPESDSGDGLITVNYTENPIIFVRSGMIIVTGGGTSDTVFVTQAAQPAQQFALIITPSVRNVDNKAGSTTYTITSNTNWTVNKDVSWLTISPEKDSGNGTITVTYSDNPSTVVRSGKIIVNEPGISDTVIIHQDSKKFLTASPTATNLPSISGNFDLFINSNTNWFLKNNLDWIHLSKNSGSDSETVKVSWETNNEITDREGYILAQGGNDSSRITIHQRARNYLSVSSDSNIVSADSGSIIISIESNTAWGISDSVNWITTVPARGSGYGIIKIIYSANIDSLKRTGNLFLTCNTGTKKIVLEQKGLEVYNIDVLVDPLNAGTSEGSGRYLSGTKVKLKVFPAKGWIFKGWEEDSIEVSKDSVYSFIVSGSRTLSAEFIKSITKNDKDIPKTVELYQNYPNPFNPSTIIKYSVPEPCFVTLKIYDILGNEITTLVNQEQSVGYYYVNFYIPSLSSGIYLYQLRLGRNVHIRKMVLLK